MPTHAVTLERKDDIAEGIAAFRFKKPDSFTFRAGQFVELTLVNPQETDGEGNTRAFTIASAPSEAELMIATRMRPARHPPATARHERAGARGGDAGRGSAFKRVLRTLPADAGTKIDGPFGSFTLHENIQRPAVFIAGGIGITPFRSISVEAARQKLPHTIFLFYSNRRPEDAAFLDELATLEHENPNYKFVPTMTDVGTSKTSQRSWDGEVGRIDMEMLKRHRADAHSPIYYIAGTASMVAAMWQMLKAAGVSGDDIKTEEFPGY